MSDIDQTPYDFSGPTEAQVTYFSLPLGSKKPCCANALEDLAPGSCIFGCGSVVDRDTGICPTCKEHSANMIECPCGAEWQNWCGEWEQQ